MRRIALFCVLGVLMTSAVAWGSPLGALKQASSPAAVRAALGQPTAKGLSPAQLRPARRRRTHGTRRITGANSRSRLLFGDQSVEGMLGKARAGLAEAFPFTTRFAGTSASLTVHLASQNRATRLIVGLYANQAGHPGSQLTSGSLPAPKAGAWNTVTIPSVPVTAGQTYWLALLGRGGMLYFNEAVTGRCKSEDSRRSTLRALPSTWVPGATRNTCAPSAYVGGARTAAAPSNTDASTGEPTATPTAAPATTSAATRSAALPAPPTNTDPPTVTGQTVVGHTLEASPGSWSGSPLTYTYQWQDCDTSGNNCASIVAAIGGSYTLASSDVGHTIRVVVTAVAAGGIGSATSPPAGVVTATAPPPPPSNTAAPSISGQAVQRQTLTSSNGSWTNSPTSYAYQWQDCNSSGASCSNISAATSSSYTLASGDVGHTIRSVVTAANAGGASSGASAPSAVVTAPPSNAAAPSISGTPTQGQTLTTSNGSWSGSPASYSYEWRRCDSSGNNCTDISGATVSTYTLTSTDVAHSIRAVVTASNSAGSASATSAQTAVVAAPPPTPAFAYSPANPATGQSVHFDASATTCSSAPCTYSWADDPPSGGTWPLGSGQTMDFTFQDPGTKYVNLTVTDAANQTATVEHDVVVASGATSRPSNTGSPSISGQAVQGQTLSASNGSWSNSPTSYSYQWEDCNSSGAGCSNVSGATSSTYTLATRDVGDTIRVVVTATNSGGSASATSGQTGVVAGQTPSAPSNTGLPSVSGQAVQGQTLSVSNGSWSNSPSSYSYQWRDCDGSGSNCASISGATGSTYQLGAGDVGDTVRAVVTATNSGGSGSATSGQSAVVQSGSSGGGATVVGTGAEPGVSCASTISVGASVQNALASASPGQVVCLNAGSWAAQTISGLTPASPGVALAAKPGAAVTMAGLSTTGTVDNLTVEGIKFTGGLDVLASGNNITVQYDTFENFADYAVEGCPACTASSNSLSSFKVVYNQIDHTAYCLRAAANNMSDWTFSHNVCGPGIGYGGNSDDHYTQTECIDGLTIDNNAFLGPFDASGLKAGVHNNVTHACGSNLEFDNNIVWHADSRAQTLLWGDDGSVSNARADNNLIVEDPTCGTTCPTVSLWAENADGASNETFSNNTIVANTGSSSGGVWTRSGITGMVSQNNIAVDDSNGDGEFSFGSCSTCTGNVADDGSGNVNWSPSWQSTSWTPTNGLPWNPPPSNYYKPVVSGGVSSASGYQGTIGP